MLTTFQLFTDHKVSTIQKLCIPGGKEGFLGMRLTRIETLFVALSLFLAESYSREAACWMQPWSLLNWLLWLLSTGGAMCESLSPSRSLLLGNGGKICPTGILAASGVNGWGSALLGASSSSDVATPP